MRCEYIKRRSPIKEIEDLSSKERVEPIGLRRGRPWPEMQPNASDETRPVIQARELVFSSPYQSIYHVAADFGEFTKEYFVNEFGTRVGLVVDRHGEILLTRQYRLLIDGISWEVPGGGLDKGETAEQAAVRECLEETGVRCANPRPLLFYHTGMDVMYSPTYLFYSDEVADETEPHMINTREVSGCDWIRLESCIDMIRKQQIVDSFSITALLAYYTFTTRQRQP